MNWALVTGASSGIGLRYATALARDYKYNVLLVSNQQKELRAAAADIAAQFGESRNAASDARVMKILIIH